ncbi:hypothetical protein [Aliiglaciecola sp. M165]|uniref:hypothetical protein n=1 Tax=Aliiglaciecola sp. M165 TaxID=2593649 RepID=UPI0011812CD6|nr:hypothetical protein [Aliiglaciecola sp. M165]TRY33411.1 hypothetical protein FM019_05400 [Aliiglaciecola sp. M165]
MKYLKSKLLVLSLTLLSFSTFANYVGQVTPQKIYGAETIRFGVDEPPAGKVCDYFGRHYQFNATTEAGKNMLSILLAAEMSNRKVDIWFTASAAPDTNHENGCVPTTMAILTAIGLVDE